MNKLQQPHESYGYYHSHEANQYTFYRLPKALFTNPRYKTISDSAKILYGLMLDRMGLSIKNNWLDEQGKVYIYFTLEDIQEHMNCKHEKAVKLFAELDTVKSVGLIERIKRGQGKPAIIYIRKFVDSPETVTSEKQNPIHSDSPKPALPKNRNHNIRKSEGNNTELNNTDINNTDSNNIHIPSIPILSEAVSTNEHRETPERKGIEAAESMSKYDIYREIIEANIEYPHLLERCKYDHECINEIAELILETVCTSRKTIRIAGDDYPAELVKSKFLKLNSEHIKFVLDCMKNNSSDIRNIKKYLLAVLFNAPSTMESYYTALAAYDKSAGKLYKDSGMDNKPADS